ncbi:histidinol-phosphatase (PHP family) [Brachybacterium sp. AG952]|uniref:PHP domain-containing protein n=1 Tax=Brachybacterium sp. AG952 TaxID=2183989 RepID=UPI00105B7143|nr:PHP domain-containing protein [Brachybacterium sp. AG952]TDP77898.1 histidinol-phosphatase (PHP family) [Brachybacterium sp. AG952]
MTSLPADSHVHSEFSWDTGGPASAARGTMRATCERAVRIGLPGLFFTEHLDLEDAWVSDHEDFDEHEAHLLDEDGVVSVPRFDVEGYLEEIDRCRAAFPELAIGTGLEFGQPGLRTDAARAQLDLTAFDRITGSLHTLELDDHRVEPNTMFRRLTAGDVIRRYLAEVPAVVAADGPHEVVTHIDYAVRYWPEEAEGPFDPRRFEEELRGAMRAIADSGRALEINTRRLRPWIPQWWAEEGGRTISFGSDSHTALDIAANFPEAMALADWAGFRPGADPRELWRR